MKVRAKKLGYYNNVRQKIGMAFFLKKKEDFSTKWMELLDEAARPMKKKPSKKAPPRKTLDLPGVNIIEKESQEIDSNSDVI